MVTTPAEPSLCVFTVSYEPAVVANSRHPGLLLLKCGLLGGVVPKSRSESFACMRTQLLAKQGLIARLRAIDAISSRKKCAILGEAALQVLALHRPKPTACVLHVSRLYCPVATTAIPLRCDTGSALQQSSYDHAL